ncbi:hypothetical protein RIF29_45456 [Crotalaria pallida]|uniref:Uncharacterized protein n=1 Tax=Crotalaria pallida TaxID=3830 RepID=A0AAN9HL77_CROPI
MYRTLSTSSAQPIQGAARFLSAASGLRSGRHSYVLLFAPYLRIQRSPLAVVLTLWLRKSPGSRFMDGFSQRKSLKLNQYQQHVVTGEGLTFLTHIQSYRHGPTDLFSIGASSSATRFYLTKPRARPGREFALPNSLFDNKAESPDPTFISFE